MFIKSSQSLRWEYRYINKKGCCTVWTYEETESTNIEAINWSQSKITKPCANNTYLCWLDFIVTLKVIGLEVWELTDQWQGNKHIFFLLWDNYRIHESLTAQIYLWNRSAISHKESYSYLEAWHYLRMLIEFVRLHLLRHTDDNQSNFNSITIYIIVMFFKLDTWNQSLGHVKNGILSFLIKLGVTLVSQRCCQHGCFVIKIELLM